MDRRVAGSGMCGTSSLDEIDEGDILDYYRLKALEMDRLVRLRVELKAPGFLYWYLFFPVLHLVFSGLIRATTCWAGEEKGYRLGSFYSKKGDANDDQLFDVEDRPVGPGQNGQQGGMGQVGCHLQMADCHPFRRDYGDTLLLSNRRTAGLARRLFCLVALDHHHTRIVHCSWSEQFPE